ncbi:MAG: hypothetical protein WC483_01405 [Candidatus Paceibacterota bacterium]
MSQNIQKQKCVTLYKKTELTFINPVLFFISAFMVLLELIFHRRQYKHIDDDDNNFIGVLPVSIMQHTTLSAKPH